MKRLIATSAALGALALPAGAMAQPTATDRTNAANECRAERGTTAATREAFRVKYGTNKNGKNAFGKCVSRRSKDEQQEQASASGNAAKACKAERALDEQAFLQKYGPNKNGKNAFGKCVSQKAKESKKAADAADAEQAKQRQSAAKKCAAERRKDPAAFAVKYGTNRNKHNAFGKCVSTKARAEGGSQNQS
jgi:hypothetical protein